MTNAERHSVEEHAAAASQATQESRAIESYEGDVEKQFLRQVDQRLAPIVHEKSVTAPEAMATIVCGLTSVIARSGRTRRPPCRRKQGSSETTETRRDAPDQDQGQLEGISGADQVMRAMRL